MLTELGNEDEVRCFEALQEKRNEIKDNLENNQKPDAHINFVFAKIEKSS